MAAVFFSHLAASYKVKIEKVPVLESQVVDRQKPLERLHSLFFENLQHERSPIVAIVGNPAEGKTELAKQYAHRFRHLYHHVWFVQVENWDAEYRNLAEIWRLFHETKSLDIDVVAHTVHAVFSKRRLLGRPNSLIIFDNASKGFIHQKLKMLLPSRSHILITSRDLGWPSTLSFSEESYCLTEAEGVEILRRWIDEDKFDLIEAKKIVHRFSNLPMLIANAGFYIASPPAKKMETYLPTFEGNKREVLKEGKHSNQPVDIVTSLDMVMKNLEPQELELLFYCAFLPGKNIPTELLLRLLEIDRHRLHHHLFKLGTLVTCDADQVTIHDAFQDILMEEVNEKPNEKDRYLSKLALCSTDYETFLWSNPAKAILIYEQGVKDAEKKENYQIIVDFLLKLVQIYYSSENYLQSLELGKRALEICQEHLKSNNEHKTRILLYIEFSLEKLGRFAECLKYQQQTLEFEKSTLGENHLDTALSYHKVGKSLLMLGRHEEALEYLLKALELRKNISGGNLITMATNYYSIGVTLKKLKRYEEALKYLQQALEIQQQALEIHKEYLYEIHTYIACSYASIGENLIQLGRHEEALSYQQQAVEFLKKSLGEDHPETTKCYANTGVILWKLERCDEALEIMKKAFLNSCKNFNGRHPDQVEYFENLTKMLTKSSTVVLCLRVTIEILPFAIEKFGANDPLVQALQKAYKERALALV